MNASLTELLGRADALALARFPADDRLSAETAALAALEAQVAEARLRFEAATAERATVEEGFEALAGELALQGVARDKLDVIVEGRIAMLRQLGVVGIAAGTVVGTAPPVSTTEMAKDATERSSEPARASEPEVSQDLGKESATIVPTPRAAEIKASEVVKQPSPVVPPVVEPVVETLDLAPPPEADAGHDPSEAVDPDGPVAEDGVLDLDGGGPSDTTFDDVSVAEDEGHGRGGDVDAEEDEVAFGAAAVPNADPAPTLIPPVAVEPAPEHASNLFPEPATDEASRVVPVAAQIPGRPSPSASRTKRPRPAVQPEAAPSASKLDEAFGSVVTGLDGLEGDGTDEEAPPGTNSGTERHPDDLEFGADSPEADVQASEPEPAPGVPSAPPRPVPPPAPRPAPRPAPSDGGGFIPDFLKP